MPVVALKAQHVRVLALSANSRMALIPMLCPMDVLGCLLTEGTPPLKANASVWHSPLLYTG